MLYEFCCNKCGAIVADYYPVNDAPPIGSLIKCQCGGNARRIISAFHLRPEFFEFPITNVGATPKQIVSRRGYEKWRREEYINATSNSHLKDTDGKLQLYDAPTKNEMKRKEEVRREKKIKAVKDTMVKTEWGDGKRKV